MSSRLSQAFVKFLIHKGVVSADDKETYLYGVNQGLLMLLNMVTFVFIGLITGTLTYVLVFLFAIIFLRSFAGGYHASTPTQCFVGSSFAVVVMAFLFQQIQLSQWVMAGLLVIIGVSIIQLSPVDSANKRLDAVEIKVYKRRAAKICLAEVIIALVFLSRGIRFVSNGIFWALVIILLLQVAGLPKSSYKFWQQNSTP